MKGVLPSELVGLRLFGSHVRGDADECSDLDVVAIYDEPPRPSARRRVESAVRTFLGYNIELAEYSSAQLREYFCSGHLFAWHLYFESRPLLVSEEADFVTHLAEPNPYTSAATDIAGFCALASRAAVGVRRCPSNVVFEGGLGYLAARNIAMAASWNRASCDFSRYSPFGLIPERLRLTLQKSEYDALVACRHASQRGLSIKSPPSVATVVHALDQISLWGQQVLAAYRGARNGKRASI